MAGLTGSAPAFALLPASRLHPHEQVDEGQVKHLADEIRGDGAVLDPVLVDHGTDVILDGHHRFAALQRLGCRLVPCYRFDYLGSGIVVEGWSGREPMDKREVIRRGLDGRLYPVKTSRHRVLSALPSRSTPLSVLRRGEP